MSGKRTKLENKNREPKPAPDTRNGRQDQPSSQRRMSPYAIAGVAAVLLATFAAFSPVLDNELTNWDDPLYITENPYIRSLDSEDISELFSPSVNFVGNYQPLTIISLAINYSQSGLDPGSYLATNVAFHVANTLLVFIFFFLLSRGRTEIAIIGSAFFGLHPMHVESVAWASGRKDVLYGFFYLLAMISYMGYARLSVRSGTKVAFYLLTVLFFVGSLLSKPAAVVFPVTLFLIDYLWKRPLTKTLIVEKIPLLLLSLALGLLTVGTQASAEAVTDLSKLNLIQRAMVPCYGIVMYLVKFFFPIHLSAFYPYPLSGQALPLIFGIAPFIVAGLAAMVIWSWNRSREVIFSASFFIISLALVLQVFGVGSAVIADRYTYLSYLGPLFLVGAAYSHVRSKQAVHWRKINILFTGSLVVFALAFALGSYRRSDVWKNSHTLWTNVIEQFPETAPIAYNNRGIYLREHGDYEAAVSDFGRAISIHDGYEDAYSNRGNAYANLGKDENAIDDFTRALEIDPTHVKAYANRGAAYIREGMYEAAQSDFAKAIEINPHDHHAYLNRAQFFLDTGQPEAMIADLDKSLVITPNNPDAYYARGTAKRRLQQYDASLRDFDRAIALRPENGQFYLGRAYSLEAVGKFGDASKDTRKASQLGAAPPQEFLAKLEQAQNRGTNEKKLASLRRAIEADPKELNHRIELANLLLISDQIEDAEFVMREALLKWPCEDELQSQLGDHTLRAYGRAALVVELDRFIAECDAPANLLNDLAYMLATAHEVEVRDPPRALRLAQRAVASFGEHPLVLDTLAVAYGANERFDEALEVSQQALSEAEKMGLPDSAIKTLRDNQATLRTRVSIRR